MSARPCVQTPVRQRHTFFIGGFDPKSAAHVYRLYRHGAAAQGAVTGERYEVGPRERHAVQPQFQQWQTVWRAGSDADDAPVRTTHECLGWDDIVRLHWARGVPALARAFAGACRAALVSRCGLVEVWRLSRRSLVPLAYPVVFWLAALTASGFTAWVVAWLVSARCAAVLAAFAGVAAGLACWWLAMRAERRLNTLWLLRIYRFVDLWARGQAQGIDSRIEKMAQQVFQRVGQDDLDEVLLVGHSVGSILAARVAARALELCESAGVPAGRFGLLTLGQCIPLLGLIPARVPYRAAFHNDLARLANAGLCWVDYSAPADWGSFGQVDPLQLCGVRKPSAGEVLPARRSPDMRSPRFHALFEPAGYALLRRDKRRLHLQYLLATPRAGDYDFFRLTAGPQRLCATGLAEQGDTP